MTVHDVIIVGAGGFAREVRQVFADQLTNQDLRFRGYLGKDHGAGHDPSIESLLLGDPERYRPAASDRFVLAIGNMTARRRTVEALTSQGGTFLTLVHPQAYVASSATLGTGVLIYPFAVVSHEAQLADYVKVNFFGCVGHNAQLGKYCLLAPYATVNGFSRLEDQVYMSTHATVGPQVRIGHGTTISANSAVTHDVAPSSFVYGVPATVQRQIQTVPAPHESP